MSRPSHGRLAGIWAGSSSAAEQCRSGSTRLVPFRDQPLCCFDVLDIHDELCPGDETRWVLGASSPAPSWSAANSAGRRRRVDADAAEVVAASSAASAKGAFRTDEPLDARVAMPEYGAAILSQRTLQRPLCSDGQDESDFRFRGRHSRSLTRSGRQATRCQCRCGTGCSAP